MFTYAIPILFFVILGAAAGAALTAADKALAVKTDETLDAVNACLPGANCGACGFSGCEQYAAAIVAGAEPNMCKPGGAEAAAKIGLALGKEVSAMERETAFVKCSGSCERKFTYKGTDSCAASKLYYAGREACRFGCAGYGDCAAVCPNNAILIENNKAVVIPELCTACGMCARACPQKLIVMRKVSKEVNVMCSSRDEGKVTKASCKSGCLGCKICEKKCPKGAVTVKEFLAEIDGGLCDKCGACVAACPVKCIIIMNEMKGKDKNG